MISTQFDYATPTSIRELHLLLNNDVEKAILSGGYNLVALLKAERLSPQLLISTDYIDTFKGIKKNPDETISIGSATRLAEIAESDVIRARYPAIIEAVSFIGDRQFCNQTTIGDEYSYLSFSMGIAAVLLAYGAVFNYSNEKSEKSLTEPLNPQQEFILESIQLPAVSGLSSFQEVKDPASLLPICGISSYLEIENGTVTAARFAVCGQGLNVQRLTECESAVIGNPVSQQLPKALLDEYFYTNKHNSGSSNEYLSHLSAVLINNSMSEGIED
jgi:carbon-monoxide dehydrogenase medium subunit